MGAMRSQVPPTLSVTIRPAVASPPRSKPGITNSDKVKSLPGTPRRPPPDFIRLRNMSNLVACRGAPVSGLCKAGRARDGLPGPLGRALRPTWTFELSTEGRRAAVIVAAAAEAPASTKTSRKPPFPFVKVVGQDELKLALILNVIDPQIGGVLILGDRGTAKSVAVRALVDLLPEIDVVPGDDFNSSPTDPKLMGPDALARLNAGETLPSVKVPTPLVELPLGATEDRICGTIDIEAALKEGVKAFEPGLLAKANRGILYVDEVNLLEDSLVDLVLDSAAGGVNTVEREGVSVVHPAKFIMIGSGNPGEGELRPQLLDRFGCCVKVATIMDTDQRVELVMNRISYEQDPYAFNEGCKEETEGLRGKIVDARGRLKEVTMGRDLMIKISTACSELNIDGLRGDLVVTRTAKALAAWEGRKEVELRDVDRVISMCLNHRMRKDVLDTIDSGSRVQIVWGRRRDPEAWERQRAEAEARRLEAEKERKAAEEARRAAMSEAEKKVEEKQAKEKERERKGLKKGAWGGLPF